MSDKHPPTVLERYRRHLDSPYGQDLHDLAEVDILACELRELVALAELAPAGLPADREFADVRAFCNTWLAELEHHGWLTRKLLLADGSELNVARLAKAMSRLAELEIEREADTRAVARVKAADTTDPSDASFAEWSAANDDLFDHFADRIAALAGDETDGSGA